MKSFDIFWKLVLSTALAVLLCACGRQEPSLLPRPLDPALYETDPSLPMAEEVWVRPGVLGGIEILWSLPSEETPACQIQVGEDASFEGALLYDAGRGPSFMLMGLEEGKEYALRLRTVDEAGKCSPWGETLVQAAAGGEEAEDLSAPYDGIYVRDQEEPVSILWKRLKDASAFEVWKSRTGKDAWELAEGMVLAPEDRRVTWTDPEDPGEGPVYYLVRSLREEGETRTFSSFSDVITASFQPLSLPVSAAAIPLGVTRTFEATYGWAGGQGLVWTSSDPETASVDQAGHITGKARGWARISVRLPDGSQEDSLGVFVDRQAPAMESLPEEAFVYDPEEGIYRQREADADGKAVLLLAGDLMSLTRQMRAAWTGKDYDFAPAFSLIRDTLEEADLTAGNLETLTAPSYSYSIEEPTGGGKALCNTSPSFLGALRGAGFDLVTMSNNHNADWGQEAAVQTVDQCEAYGLLHTGLFRSREEDRTLVLEIAGIRIGILAYDGGGVRFNGKDETWPKEDKETILNAYDPERAEADIQALKEKGADYILVCMHWGVINERQVTKSQKRVARELADLGADYIAGSHPHLVQRYDLVRAGDGREVPCIYSLGNFITNLDAFPGQRDSVLMRLVLTRDESGKVLLSENACIPCHTFDEAAGIPYAALPLTEEKADLLPDNWEEIRAGILESTGDKIAPFAD